MLIGAGQGLAPLGLLLAGPTADAFYDVRLSTLRRYAEAIGANLQIKLARAS